MREGGVMVLTPQQWHFIMNLSGIVGQMTFRYQPAFTYLHRFLEIFW